MKKNADSEIEDHLENSLFPSFKNVFFHTFFIRALNIGLGLLASIILARALGPDGRGELALFVVTVQILLPIGTLVYGSNSILLGEHNKRKGKLFLHTALFVTSVAAIIFLIVILLDPSFRSYFLGDENQVLVWLLAALLWMNMMQIGLKELLLARQEFYNINYISLSGTVIYLSILIIFLWMAGFGIKWAIIALICQQGIMVMVYTKNLFSRNSVHSYTKSIFKIDYPLLKKAFSINKRTFLAGIPTLLLLKVDIWILGIITNNSTVGLYQISATICMLLMVLGEIMNQITKGKAVSERGDQIIKSSLLASKLICLVGIVSFIVIVLFGKSFLGILYGNEFIPSYPSLVILMLATIFWGAALPLAGFVVGRYKYPSAVVIGMNIAMVLNIILNIVLIPQYLEVGAAIASLIAYFVMAFTYAREFKKRSGIPFRDLVLLSKNEISLIKDYISRLRGSLP